MAFDAILWAKLKSSASLVGGKVPSEQLPSYVDEVIEVTSYSNLPQPGVAGKIYYTLDKKESYRWGSSSYILVNSVNTDALAKVDDLNALQSHIENTYAKRSDLTDLASEAFVLEKIADIKIPEVDLSGYYTKNETYSRVQVDANITSAIAAIEFPKTDLSEYAKKSELPIVPNVLSAFDNDVGYLTEHQSLAGYATEQFVHDQIEKIDISHIDMTDYAKISDIPTTTSQLVNDSGFITEIPSDNLKVDKSTYESDMAEFDLQIQSKQDKLISGKNIATINGKSLLSGENIEISGSAISSPDDIIFNFSEPTTFDVGGISAGTLINNWSLTKLVQSMLFKIISIIEKILNNSLPALTLSNGELVETEFSELHFTDETENSSENSGLSGFYTITSGDQIIEQGYQIQTTVTGLKYKNQFAIPSGANVIRVDTYDEGSGGWSQTTADYEKNDTPIEVSVGDTVYPYDVYTMSVRGTGIPYRVIIE